MRKTLAFLLMLVMALSFVAPAMATAVTPAAEKTEAKPLAKDDKFYVRANQGAQTVIGAFDYASNTIAPYENVAVQDIFAMEYVATNDTIYAVINDFWADTNTLVRYDGMDAFKNGKYEVIGTASTRIVDLTMDYSTNTMYAVADKYYGNMALLIVDTQNGSFTEVGKLAQYTVSVALDENGDMYGVTTSTAVGGEYGKLYSVNKETAEMTAIGSLGITNTMDHFLYDELVYDYDTNTMYYFGTNEGGVYATNGVYVVNLKNGEASFQNNAAGYNVLSVFTVCENTPKPESTDPTGLEVAPATLSLVNGDSYTLKATVLPSDAYIEDRSVTWSSSDETVAQVSAAGVVTANKVGTATITATSNIGGFTASCELTVTDEKAAYQELSVALNKVYPDDENFILFATDTKEGGYPWKVASYVDSRASVGASTNKGVNNSVSYVQNWKPMTLVGGSKLRFDFSTSTPNEGQSGDALRLYVNNELVYIEDVMPAFGVNKWRTFEVTIDRSGEYTFRWEYYKDARTTSLENVEDTVWLDNIEVVKAKETDLTGIALTPATVDLFQRQNVQLAVQYQPASALPVAVTYESNDTSVATVDENGLVTAVGGGTAVITATAEGGFKAQSTINVTPVYYPATMPYSDTAEIGKSYDYFLNTMLDMGVESYRYAHSFKVEMKAGEAFFLETSPRANMLSSSLPDPKVRVYDKDFKLLAESENNKSSSDRYYYDNLRFVALETGTYYVLVYSEQYYTYDVMPNTNTPTTLLTVKLSAIEPVHVEELKVPFKDINLKVGEHAKVQTILLPYVNDFPTVTFTSADKSIATVDSVGNVTAVKAGETTVTVTVPDGNLTEEVKVTVSKDESFVPEYDGKIYGFTLASGGVNPRGFVQYDPDNAEQTIDLVAIDNRDFYSAVYHDGTIYAYVYEQVNQESFNVQFVTLDAQTFSEQNRVKKGNEIAVDMTYDHKNNVIYAAVQDLQNYTQSFATVNPKTGDINRIKSWSLPRGATMMTIEMAGDGTLYGIGSDGWLYEIDPATGTTTEIKQMRSATDEYRLYFNTMVYDNDRNLMYWFPFTKNGTEVICFNPDTTDIEFDEALGDGMVEFTCGIIFNEYDEENDEPVPPPTTYTVTFEDFEGNVASTVEVREGRTAVAPTVKHPDGIKFMCWDKDITNVREDMTVKPLAVGDVNKDYGVNAGDATLILRHVVGSSKLDDEKATFADTNGNEAVETGDATIVLRYVVSKTWGGQKD